jgi:four helix bundle protein
MPRHNFRKLNSWIDGVELVSMSYKLTKMFRKSEVFNLTSQMNRCSVSIPSNIAEGSAKSSDKHFKVFL